MRVRHALLLMLLPMLGWWTTGLLDLDEGFYGAVGAEMNRRAEWITPFYNGRPWFEKPILVYWLLKPFLAVFGEFGARLPSVLCFLLTGAAMTWWSARRFRPGAAVLVPVIWAGMLLPVALGRLLMTDMPLVLCLTVAFLAYWESRERPWWLFVTGASLGAGVLAKGPVALLLFAPVLLVLAVRSREDRIRLLTGLGALALVASYWALFPWVASATISGRLTSDAGLGIIVLASLAKFGFVSVGALQSRLRSVVCWCLGWHALVCVVLSWYGPCWGENGDAFVQGFLIEQNLNRFTGGDRAHTLNSPFAYLGYVPVALLGAGPWLVRLLVDRFRKLPAERSEPTAMLVAWAATVFLFFTISGAKLPHYILPMFPPLALLAADRWAGELKARKIAIGWTVGMAIFANIAFPVWYRLSGQEEAHRLARPLRSFEGTIATYQLSRREKSLGTGKLKIQETSLPSLGLVWNRTWLDTDDWSQIEAAKGPIAVFTRTGRIEAPPPGWTRRERGGNYEVWTRR